MLPDRVSSTGLRTYESGALPTAHRFFQNGKSIILCDPILKHITVVESFTTDKVEVSAEKIELMS